MIKINLLGDVQVKDHTHVLQLIAAGTLMLTTILVCFVIQSSLYSEEVVLTEQKGDLEMELERLKKITAEVKALEKSRKELEGKLSVIAKLKGSKLGPVQAIDDLNLALPERAWLLEVRESQSAYRINGFALDNQTIAGFLKKLEDSPFFSNVELIETKQAEKQGVKFKDFSLSTEVDYAGGIKNKVLEKVDQKGNKEEQEKDEKASS